MPNPSPTAFGSVSGTNHYHHPHLLRQYVLSLLNYCRSPLKGLPASVLLSARASPKASAASDFSSTEKLPVSSHLIQNLHCGLWRATRPPQVVDFSVITSRCSSMLSAPAKLEANDLLNSCLARTTPRSGPCLSSFSTCPALPSDTACDVSPLSPASPCSTTLFICKWPQWGHPDQAVYVTGLLCLSCVPAL